MSVDKTSYILSHFPGKSPNARGLIHGSCPFHDDQHPSFSIDVEDGFFFCGSSSCGVRGGFPLFYKMMENIDSWQAVYEVLKSVTSHYSIDDLLGSKKATKKGKIVNSFPESALLEPIGEVDYLVKRGLGAEVVQAFGLQYGKHGVVEGVHLAGSIVAPIWDLDGSFQTFQVRYLSPTSEKRWMNPSGSPIQNLLYGGWLVQPEDKRFWIVEGASDTWKLFTFGQRAVGLNTKEASFSQRNKISKLSTYLGLQPIVMLDGDASCPRGPKQIDFSEKIFCELAAMNLNPGIVKLKYEEDPGGLSYERFAEVCQNIRY